MSIVPAIRCQTVSAVTTPVSVTGQRDLFAALQNMNRLVPIERRVWVRNDVKPWKLRYFLITMDEQRLYSKGLD